MVYEDQKKELVKLIRDSKHIVFFGGAGVSTESGIPDFRSKDGLYNQHDVQFDQYSPEYLLSHTCLYHNPKVFFEFYRLSVCYYSIYCLRGMCIYFGQKEQKRNRCFVEKNSDSNRNNYIVVGDCSDSYKHDEYCIYWS